MTSHIIIHRAMVLMIAAVLAALSVPARAAGCPGNLIPMYEGVEKTGALAEADRKFRQAAADAGQTPQEGARHGVMLGWRYYVRDGDPATAMKRFNQAWLLDPENGDAYHGMAVMSLVLSERSAYADCPFTPERAEALFKKALDDDDVTPGAYADYGRFLVISQHFSEAIAPLETAMEHAPSHAQAKLHLAVAYEKTGATGKACGLLKQARAAIPKIPQSSVDEVCAQAAAQ